MSVIIASEEGAPAKAKGDLLENLAKELLGCYNYVVETEIRKTGSELDLLCRGKANAAKKIYVECKAFDEKTKVQSEVIKQLVGTRTIQGHSEAWLISASELGKDAKGLVEEIVNGRDSRSFTFLTPDLLIDALIDSRLVKSSDVAFEKVAEKVGDRKLVRPPVLFITTLGYFWAVKIIKGGEDSGIYYLYASDCQIIDDRKLLEKMAKLSSSLKTLDHFTAISISGKKEALDFTPPKLCKTYLSQINDLNAKLSHPSGHEIFVDDVFVFPDLEDIDDKEHPRVNSRSIVMTTGKKIMIFGEDLSGKTSLAYQIQRKLNQIDYIPIYIDASEIKQSAFPKFTSLLERKFKKQYYDDNRNAEDNFREIFTNDRDKICIIIDNYESLGIKRTDSIKALFEILEEHFKSIFLFANKSIELEIMAKAETKEILTDFKIYRMLQLGHVKRDELIERWLTVDEADTLEDGYILGRKTEISHKVNIAVGTNFIPTYPFYLLTMLHLFDAGNKGKLQGSSYAELYGFLINQSLLSVNAKPEDLDFYHTYLSYVANYFFTHDIANLESNEMQNIFDDYCRTMDLEKSFDLVHKLLVKAKLLRSEDDHFSFQLSYCRYFFIAKYLSDNIENDPVKLTISHLVNRLHKNEHANIVVFLIHHSKNKEIINSVIKQAKQLFVDIKPYTLSTDELASVNGLVKEELRLSYQDSNPAENRKKDLEKRDEAEEANHTIEEDKESDELDLFAKMNSAFKTMEVLGQIANNYYGSLDGESKAAIIEELYGVGLRALRAFLGDSDEYIDAIKHNFGQILEDKGPKEGNEKEKLINKITYAFIQLIVITFLKRISDNVTSSNLFPTIKRITGQQSTPAFMLINTAVHLNFPRELTKNKSNIIDLYKEFDKSYLPKDLLRFLVAYHMYKFEVAYIDKQSICSKLDIDFVKASQMSLQNK